MIALTKSDPIYPGYINISEAKADGSVTVIVRADPTTHIGAYVCANARDRGKPGRCCPGDECCNNYCNLASEKGPMQDSPMPCQHTVVGNTATIVFSAFEWAKIKEKLNEIQV